MSSDDDFWESLEQIPCINERCENDNSSDIPDSLRVRLENAQLANQEILNKQKISLKNFMIEENKRTLSLVKENFEERIKELQDRFDQMNLILVKKEKEITRLNKFKAQQHIEISVSACDSYRQTIICEHNSAKDVKVLELRYDAFKELCDSYKQKNEQYKQLITELKKEIEIQKKISQKKLKELTSTIELQELVLIQEKDSLVKRFTNFKTEINSKVEEQRDVIADQNHTIKRLQKELRKAKICIQNR